MSDHYYMKIGSLGVTVAMLSGDVEKVEALLRANNNQPVFVALNDWYSQPILVDSYLLAYVLYDAFRYDDRQDLFVSKHIQEILDLHKRLCPPREHPDYSTIDFIKWNDWVYFEDDDMDYLLNEGVARQDIELTNCCIQHREKEVIRLLKNGASPYFFTSWNLNPNNKDDWHYTCFEVSPMFDVLDYTMCDQWFLFGLCNYEKDINTLSIDEIEMIVFSLFNAAASYRILYLVDRYISPEARQRGKELMRKFLSKEFNLLRYKPENV